jgi:hypothetical protein
MLINNYPKWYLNALKNKDFYESDEFLMLLQAAIDDYNKAIASKDKTAIEKHKDIVMKWLEKKETNRFMLMQYAG